MANKLSNLKFIQTIKNIWKVEDLRVRIGITLLFIAIYRFGSFVVLPGVDTAKLGELASQTKDGLMSLLDMFSGGAFSHASIFALGIMPYISASIVVQLLAIVVPSFQKMQREGESGRRKINQYTRYLTIAILIPQGIAYLANLKATAGAAIINSGWAFMITSTIVLAAGSMFILWLGERITDKGLGNGVSLIIMIGIMARLPEALGTEFLFALSADGAASGGLVKFLVEIVVLILVICAGVALLRGTRKIPVQYAKQATGGAVVSGARQYLPLKVNAANVMPIIFAQAIMFIPLLIMGTSKDSWFAIQMNNPTSWLYNSIFALLIILFTYLYTAITINPMQMAEDMKRNNGFIPGIKPGKPTAEYIDTIMSRITLPGSLFLAAIAVLPAFAQYFGVQTGFAGFFGGTSLLILVGVILDTLQQIESYLMMRHYDGLLSSGRIKGRVG